MGNESPIEKAARVFSQPPIPDDWRQAFEEIKNETVNRLRNLLHEGKLHGYYFDNESRERVENDALCGGGARWSCTPSVHFRTRDC